MIFLTGAPVESPLLSVDDNVAVAVPVCKKVNESNVWSNSASLFITVNCFVLTTGLPVNILTPSSIDTSTVVPSVIPLVFKISLIPSSLITESYFALNW